VGPTYSIVTSVPEAWMARYRTGGGDGGDSIGGGSKPPKPPKLLYGLPQLAAPVP